ncbi:ATP-dependent DNA helicase [Haloarcula sp. K1]|uniref:ATP-dependent DNA helicase n=1 Tax=Haloarcula sp. K1 TaxID=1622207 RepID=UPI0007BC545B|nr:ATP-dependent DNA helicase [Haloarcula sp. K1]KZX46205.1 hypothetical protein AV929_15645 [Haloarcula sp. K1]
MAGQKAQGQGTDWRDIFPYDPYDKQTRGITTAIDILRDNGVYLLEGPCGTGKTLIALTAGLTLVRNPNTKYQRILVITSKKQQIRAFEDDLKEINAHGGDFEGLTLVGKADVCPFVDAGVVESKDIYHKCDELKENTDRLMREASNDGVVEVKAEAAYELAARAESDAEPLMAGGAKAPYQDSIPVAEGEEYCPFFAQHFANDYQDKQPVTVDEGMTAIETMANGVRAGTCPHIAMKQMATGGDVLIGNYAHVFAPLTVEGFTGRVMNEETLLIVDEAHELVSEVRDELSHAVTMNTLNYAIGDVSKALKWLNGNGYHRKVSLVRAMEERGSFEQNQIKALYVFLKEIRQLFANRITEFLKQEYGSNWKRAIRAGPDALSEHSIQIQNEEGKDGDILERWVDANAEEGDWVQALYLSYAVGSIRDAVARKVEHRMPEGDFAITEVRELLHRWLIGNHTEYFREILLIPEEPTSDIPDDCPWRAGFRAELKVNNCIPEKEIAATLDAFGGTILQSATLAPIDVYSEETGVDLLEEGLQPSHSLVTKAAARYNQDQSNTSQQSVDGSNTEDGGDGGEDDESKRETLDPDERKRRVEKSMFKMDFPKENRASFAVDVPKFTYSNRWPPEEHRDLRDQYNDIITTVATTTPGNVLVFMPSYAEANWAAQVLEKNQAVSKPVLSDESSSDAETERLKREFISGEPKVLTTGLRGTLVEGVDFSGDKLSGAVICGVPIAHTGSELAEAIEAAYGYRFGGGNGFDYAYTVPAIRKTRQALGRVIRGTDDIGVRVVADERYARSDRFSDVREHFPKHVRDEFTPVKPGELQPKLEQFWRSQR